MFMEFLGFLVSIGIARYLVLACRHGSICINGSIVLKPGAYFMLCIIILNSAGASTAFLYIGWLNQSPVGAPPNVGIGVFG